MPHHDCRPVHPPRHVVLLADQALGLELGAVIRRGQALAGVEHVLGEHAVVIAGHRHRGDVVQAARVDVRGQLDDLPGALDVGQDAHLVVRGDVVEGGEVHDVIDFAAQVIAGVVGDPESVRGQVTAHQFDPAGVRPATHEVGQPVPGGIPDQEVYPIGWLVFEQQLGEVATDQPGRTSDEITGHGPYSAARPAR